MSGIFMIFDAATFLESALDGISERHMSKLSLALREEDGEHLVSSSTFSTTKLLGDAWFEPLLSKRKIKLGDSQLVVFVESVRGIPQSFLAKQFSLLLFACYCVSFRRHILAQPKAQDQTGYKRTTNAADSSLRCYRCIAARGMERRNQSEIRPAVWRNATSTGFDHHRLDV